MIEALEFEFRVPNRSTKVTSLLVQAKARATQFGVDMYYIRPQATLAGSRIRNWQKFECMMMLKMLERKAQDPSTTLRQCRTRFRSEVSSCSVTPQEAFEWYVEVVNAIHGTVGSVYFDLGALSALWSAPSADKAHWVILHVSLVLAGK